MKKNIMEEKNLEPNKENNKELQKEKNIEKETDNKEVKIEDKALDNQKKEDNKKEKKQAENNSKTEKIKDNKKQKENKQQEAEDTKKDKKKHKNNEEEKQDKTEKKEKKPKKADENSENDKSVSDKEISKNSNIKADSNEEKSNKKNKKEKYNKKNDSKLEKGKKKDNEKDNNKKIDKKEKKINEDKTQEPKIHKKPPIKKIIISAIIVAIVALIFSTVFAFANINNQTIISGVTIKGIEVSGLTKEEAIAKLETIYAEKMENDIMLQYEEFESELNPTLMEVSYDIEKAVNEAYSLGRDGNIFVNNYNILGTLIGKRDFDVDMTMNEETTKQTIEDIGANLPNILVESTYSIEDDELIITRGTEGVVIDTDTLLSEVKDMLNDINETENVIEIPVQTKTPQDIDVDKIHDEVYQEPQDAYYTEDPFTVYPEVEGIDFDVEAAKAMIEAEVKDEYIIELIITEPEITLADIGAEAFPDELATFSTRYDASDTDRTTNLEIACSKIDGTIILPGETFSYNDTLGPRTTAAGYKNAKVYENGQVVDGIGGGICQISSTLYNVALMSDMEIVERRNHQFVTSYVSAGRDATVVYGTTDFQFKNTRTYPVMIEASAKSGVATVSIYGIKEEDREYTYSFSTKTISTIAYTTKYVEDSSLSAGQEVVKQSGANGLVCETYMTKMLDGKIVSTELLSRDTYSAMQRIVNIGVGTTSSSKSSSSSTTTQTTTEATSTEQQTETAKEPEETTDTETTNTIETTE